MTDAGLAAVVALGAFHGANPGMGWLFAVARGMYARDRRAVVASLGPIAVGHLAAVAAALLAGEALTALLGRRTVALVLAAGLVTFGLWRLVRRRHVGWVGLNLSRRDLVLWSFVMASAHGAGLMLLPVTVAGVDHPATGLAAAAAGARATLLAVGVHTVAMLVMMAGLALVVYDSVGVGILRRTWVNVDLLWAAALVAAGVAVLLL